MITRLLALLLLAATTLAAAADPPAPALLFAGPEAADWKALLGAALVALYVARRRSRWLAG